MTINSRKLQSLGRKIKSLRNEKGLTQEVLAEKVRLSTTYIGFIEQGQRNPSLKTLDRIARALGVKVSTLLE